MSIWRIVHGYLQGRAIVVDQLFDDIKTIAIVEFFCWVCRDSGGDVQGQATLEVWQGRIGTMIEQNSNSGEVMFGCGKMKRSVAIDVLDVDVGSISDQTFHSLRGIRMVVVDDGVERRVAFVVEDMEVGPIVNEGLSGVRFMEESVAVVIRGVDVGPMLNETSESGVRNAGTPQVDG